MSNTEQTAPRSDGLLARVAMLESDLATERAALAASRALVEQLTEERDHLRVSHDRLRQELELLRRRIFIAKAERVDRNWNLRRSCPRSTPCQGDLPSSLSRPTSGLARVRTARVIRLLRRSRPGVATCAKPIFLKFASRLPTHSSRRRPCRRRRSLARWPHRRCSRTSSPRSICKACRSIASKTVTVAKARPSTEARCAAGWKMPAPPRARP